MRLIRFDRWQTGVMVTDDEFGDMSAKCLMVEDTNGELYSIEEN